MARAILQVNRSADLERARITLGLLQSVEKDGEKTQRRLASELGIALGLVNTYLRRCAAKGLLKVSKVPARRYTYYLTRRGFLEKSRLTVEYLSYSFEFFRRAREEYRDLLKDAEARGARHVVLLGASELAEIATLCAMETSIEISAIVDPASKLKSLVGRQVLTSLDLVPQPVDAVVMTDMKARAESFAECRARFGLEQIYVPAMLGGIDGNGK